jgi:hypothetical protein
MNNSYPARRRADPGNAAKSSRAVPTKRAAFIALKYTIIRIGRKGAPVDQEIAIRNIPRDPSVSIDLLVRSLFRLGGSRQDLVRHLAAPSLGGGIAC